jgi:release factor glutamine methyltransferase
LSTWTVLELIRWTTGYLTDKGVPDARLDAEILLADTLGLKRLDLYLQFDRPLLEEELGAFKRRLLRRARREPLQYIAGTAAFRQLHLCVDRRVLIPRPETEVLVDHVLAWARGREGLRAVDIGTGSGAIALSLATEGRSFSQVVATDVSEEALQVAHENLARVAPAVPVELRLGPALQPLGEDRFDVIVSNPPYIGERETGELEPEVVSWEPTAALFSGEDGLDVIRQLVDGAVRCLRPGGLLALEIGAGQGEAVLGLIESRGGYAKAELRQDLAGRDRIVLAETAPADHRSYTTGV